MYKVLSDMGLSRRLIETTEEDVPPELRPYINDPSKPLKGHGLLGSIGGGKSSLEALNVRQRHEFRIDKLVRTLNDPELSRRDREKPEAALAELTSFQKHVVRKAFYWVYWPDCYNYFQANAISGELSKLNATYSIDMMKSTRLLILDDIGRDSNRNKGEGVAFATTQLESIINHRNQERLPIIWTSNLDEKQLILSMGAATYTRLVEDNSPKGFLKLPNLRDNL